MLVIPQCSLAFSARCKIIKSTFFLEKNTVRHITLRCISSHISMQYIIFVKVFTQPKTMSYAFQLTLSVL